MALKSSALVACFLIWNLLASSLVSAQTAPPPGTCPSLNIGELRICVLAALFGNPNTCNCQTLGNLASIDAAACLCITIRLSLLGIVNATAAVPTIIKTCGNGTLPVNFTCPP